MLYDRVQQIIVRKGDVNFDPLGRICAATKREGNCATYYLRHVIFFGIEDLGSKQATDQKMKELYPDDYKAMPSAASAQRTTQVIHEQFESFLAASKEYKLHPEKFTGKPKLPGYAKKFRTFCVGRNGFKIENGLLYISGGDKFGLKPVKVTCCKNQPFNPKASDVVCSEVRICPKANSFVIEIVYRKEVNLEKFFQFILLDENESLLIDLGLDNIAACVSTKSGVPPLLVKGGALKSINQWYNKRAAELRSNGKFHHLAAISFKRNNRINDCIHKIARIIISHCLAYDLGRIVIGQNKDWKQRINLGKVNNQKFCNIPHTKLVNTIKYMAEDYGIHVIVREESYTSKASALDFDKMPDSYQKDVECHFSGKRVKRGLYRTSKGKLINADLNGALNIGRKELGDEWLHAILANGGLAGENLQVGASLRVDKPVVIRNLHNKVDCGTLLKAGQRLCETADVSQR